MAQDLLIVGRDARQSLSLLRFVAAGTAPLRSEANLSIMLSKEFHGYFADCRA